MPGGTVEWIMLPWGPSIKNRMCAPSGERPFGDHRRDLVLGDHERRRDLARAGLADLLQELALRRHLADRPQWVARWHKIVQMTHREKALGEGVGSAHGVVFDWVSESTSA